MNTIICDVKGCKYNGGMFCKKEVVKLATNGGCGIWYHNDGSVRQNPNYYADSEQDTKTEKNEG